MVLDVEEHSCLFMQGRDLHGFQLLEGRMLRWEKHRFIVLNWYRPLIINNLVWYRGIRKGLLGSLSCVYSEIQDYIFESRRIGCD